MKKILDIGCGTGYRTYLLSKEKNCEVYGIDISRKNIKLAKKRYPKVKFKCMDAERLKFPDGSFDLVCAIDVLEHVDNLPRVLEEISRVTKHGKLFRVVVPGERSEKFLLKLRPSFHKEIHHVRIFKDTEVTDLMSDYGFKIKKRKSQNFLQHLELFYFFKTKRYSMSQLDIGSWNDSVVSTIVHACVSLFDPFWVFNTPLKFLPVWIITLPIGLFVNGIGNRIMPKSIYYEFIKVI